MRQNRYNQAANILIEKMESVAAQAVSNAAFNKTVWGRITAIEGVEYTLVINGKTYPKTYALSSAGTLAVGDTVICIVPNNNMPNFFILGKIKK